MNRKFAAAIAWLIVTLFFGGLGGTLIAPQMIDFYDLGKLHQTATGEIVEVYPHKHSTCKYRFNVDNHDYENTGGSCGEALVGEKFTVYFSPNNPQKSVNSDPQRLFINDLAPFVLALVIFPLLAAIGVYKKWR